ncbi:metallophosphoesterase [Schnuerera sp.]|uniref:metallophosphoesterase n=1 Tax=Schnuerera sp. TaxID=2794844 RepID=UPI002BA65BB3|nr:metallophosphoesterase [Schnuerera sp.]HSH34893.1 metallophosphoesterase [Schnuerera sp.]
MIYGIGDLHLDYSQEKPMDVFGDNWIDHEKKIFSNWNQLVGDEDLVLLPGDISWALKLKKAYDDLKRIDDLPGYKIITKGNHDYWWQGPKKLKELNLKTITFVQNDSYIYNNIGIGGTRGWISEDYEGFDKQDEKVFNRELNRLNLSLTSIKKDINIKIAMLHYPPFNMDGSPNKFVDLMIKHHIDICIYGHLHAEGHRFVVEDKINGIQFYCVSSDFIDFKPKKII